MRIYIMTDMEGSAGIINFTDWVEREGKYYETGKKLVSVGKWDALYCTSEHLGELVWKKPTESEVQ